MLFIILYSVCRKSDESYVNKGAGLFFVSSDRWLILYFKSFVVLILDYSMQKNIRQIETYLIENSNVKVWRMCVNIPYCNGIKLFSMPFCLIR